MQDAAKPKYPLLQEILELRGLKLQPTYANRDVATIFGVSIRTIQDHIKRGSLSPRKLLGTGRFLPADLEEYIQGSRGKGR